MTRESAQLGSGREEAGALSSTEKWQGGAPTKPE
eukprot:CAMPEP_0177585758 /NCGR_PEP_ID=MMETSP0419_2-20121207/4684_1 /TAXON_ID=582737 /ORGANISM="Tetraselmis sp., Strain GSL018" /LENGTH=33 /DNA_ID= /DNA_START= /DNA_END= /DNA_ORIENTATION=